MTPAEPLLFRVAGRFGSSFSGVINMGQCELGTHLSLWQAKERGSSPSGADSEVTDIEKQKQRGRQGVTLSLWIQQCPGSLFA